MAFDPTAFPSLAEGPEQAAEREATYAFDAKLDAKYSDPKILAAEKRSLAESFGFKPFQDPTLTDKGKGNNEIVDGEEENPDVVLVELDGVSEGEGNTRDDILGGGNETGRNEPAKKGVEKTTRSDGPENEGKAKITPENGEGNGLKNEVGTQGKEVPTENIEKPSKQLSSEYTPLIESFVGDGKLSPQEAHALINTGIDAENFETVIENSGLPKNKQTALMESCNYLGSEKHKESAKAELETQIPEMFAKHKAPKKGVNNSKIGKTNSNEVSGGDNQMEWVSAHAEEAFGEIAAHYVGNAKTTEEQQAQLNLAFQMSAEKLGKQALSGVNISNQESYNNALKVAMSGENTPEARFDAITTLAGIKNTSAGSLAEKKGNMNKNTLRATLEEAGEYQAFLQAQEALLQAQKTNNPSAIQLAEAQRDEILAKANISKGAIGEMDIAMEGISESPTKTA